METLQCGWLLVQVGIIKRWKKKWFCLSHYGSLLVSSRPYAQPDGMFDLPSECKEIRFGEACGKIKHPKVHDEENLLICIVLDVTTFVLLASSEGEFLDWKTSLELVTSRPDCWSLQKECDQIDCHDTVEKNDVETPEVPPLTPRQQIELMYCNNKRSIQRAKRDDTRS